MTDLINFGGEGQTLQFLHANAYTPHCYHQVLDPLTSHYAVHGYKLRPLYGTESPATLHNWRQLISDVITVMDRDGIKGAIGVGHSLGAMISWLVSLERPDLFSQLILLDPVFLPRKLLFLSKVLPFWVKEKIHPLVKVAMRRRDHWDSRQDASHFFLQKKIFQRWDRAAFDDFIAYGLVDDDKRGGVTLAYSREWEAHVYASVVYSWSLMKRSTVPTHIIRAEHSDVLLPANWQLLQRRLPNATFYTMPDVGHLLPMEQPKEVAALIHKHMQRISVS